MNPIYYDANDIAIFTSRQIDDYGLPELNGWYEDYLVVEDRELVMGASYEDKLNLMLECTKKPIHRYNRIDRFRTCLLQLTGHIGFVGRSSEMIEDLGLEHVDTFHKHYLPPCLMWDYFRNILKGAKKQCFYNRIPAFAKGLGMIQPAKLSGRQLRSIMEDFHTMHITFPRLKETLGRKYFPSFRATALLLLERYGVELPIDIPLARCKLKSTQLREDFERIWDLITIETHDFYFG